MSVFRTLGLASLAMLAACNSTPEASTKTVEQTAAASIKENGTARCEFTTHSGSKVVRDSAQDKRPPSETLEASSDTIVLIGPNLGSINCTTTGAVATTITETFKKEEPIDPKNLKSTPEQARRDTLKKTLEGHAMTFKKG